VRRKSKIHGRREDARDPILPSREQRALRSRYPKAQIVSLDFSRRMLGLAKPGLLERLAGRKSHRLCADIGGLPLCAGAIDLLWSNMVLHWAVDPPAALQEFHRVLAPEGLLMFSSLGPDTLKELRSAAGASRVHHFVDMHDLGDMLIEAGFAAPVMDTETITLTYAGTDELLADLRGSGQTCALAGRGRGLMGARGWHRVQEALEKRKQSGRLPTTVEVVYGHAWKAAPRRNAEGHAIVNLDPGRKKRN